MEAVHIQAPLMPQWGALLLHSTCHALALVMMAKHNLRLCYLVQGCLAWSKGGSTAFNAVAIFPAAHTGLTITAERPKIGSCFARLCTVSPWLMQL